MTEGALSVSWIELMHEAQQFIRKKVSGNVLEQTRKDLIDRGITTESQLSSLVSPELGGHLKFFFQGY